MNSITIRQSDGSEVVYACNSAHLGVFRRRPHDGAYSQEQGTSQTPWFRDWRHFRRYIAVPGRCVDHSFFTDRT